jgi:hypothetical protein
LPKYRDRLSRARQRIYDRSNGTPSIRLQASLTLRRAVATLPAILEVGDRSRVERVAQLIADQITVSLHVPPVRLIVGGTRPSNTKGELHGLYTPAENGTRSTIHVWMMTAKRQEVVAPRTFLRTLLHEVCHHLDYALLRLPDSLHTEGFYQRESSLFHQLGGAALTTPARRAEPARITRSAASARGPASADGGRT